MIVLLPEEEIFSGMSVLFAAAVKLVFAVSAVFGVYVIEPPRVAAPVGVLNEPELPEKLTFPLPVAAIAAENVVVPVSVSPPAMVCADPNVLKIKLAAPPASGSVYTREAAGAVALIVVVLVVPKTS